MTMPMKKAPPFNLPATSFLCFVSLALALGCSPSSGQKNHISTSEVNMTAQTARQKECVGRFSWQKLDSVAVTGRSQSIYRTNVEHILIPPGGIDAYWAARLSKIGPEAKIFSIEPGVKSSWSSRNVSFPNILTLEVVKPVQGGLIVADTEAQTGKESIAEGLMKDIINGFEPTIDYGFCIGGGAIMLEPSQYEEAGLVLTANSSTKIEVQFDTRTVTQPDTTTYSDLDEEESLIAAHGGKLTVLKNAERSAAGLSGKEIRISAESPGEEATVRFTWHYPGVAASSTQPAIDIVGSSPAKNQAELQSIWESMLTSLRAVPLPPNPK
jgi:hypothetical protein